MEAFFIWLCFIWFFICFLDTIFKSCMFHPYFRALQITGLEIQPLTISCHITRFNRYFNRMGFWTRLFFRNWFTIGAFVTCVVIFPCLLLYVKALYQTFYSSTVEEYESSLLVPIIPGFNFPMSHWKMYVFLIAICTVFHELGHALAASRERVGIENCGFIMFIIFPIAFVNVRQDQFGGISKFQQMRILCGGIWHNIVLAFWALQVIVFFTIIFSPLFCVGCGVSVMEIHEDSNLNSIGGFSIGDHVYEIGGCPVEDVASWKYCLREEKRLVQGLCIPEYILADNTYNLTVKQCTHWNSWGSLYFKTHKKTGGVCLHARTAVQGFPVCSKTHHCGKSYSCMFPQLPDSHKFVVIRRFSKPTILYDGPIDEILNDVIVSEYVPRSKSFSASFAETSKLFMQYLFMFSSGLACLNVLPIDGFDGKYIIENLVHSGLASIVPTYSRRRYIFLCINRFTWGLMICLALLTTYKFYLFYF